MLQKPKANLLLFVFIPILSLAGNNPGKWVKINPSLTPQALKCIFFVNPAVGWAGGMNGAIVHTEDSGATWQLQQTPRNCAIWSIYFHDVNEGWAVGKYGSLYTADGGKHWVQRNIGNDSLIIGYKIYFQNRNVGWLSFSSDNLPPFAKTEDGGKSWIDCSGLVENSRLNDIKFPNDSIGFICADKYLARTENGGKTWMTMDTVGISVISPFSKFQMLDALTGYCLGWFGIAKTVDGGKTWSIVLLDWSGGDFVDLYFSCADTGLVFWEYDHMRLFRTNDGGKTWSNKILHNLQDPITSISFPEKNKGIGTNYNGGIDKILGESDSVFEITSGTGDELMCMDFGDTKHGYAGTGHAWPRDSALLFTTDGGATWEKRKTPLKTIDKLLCFDSNTIVIYGGMDTLVPQHVFRSIDCGLTWSGVGNFDYFYKLKKIRNVQNAAYFLTANTDELFITFDAGQTWVHKNLPTNNLDSLSRPRGGLSFLNADTAWLLSDRNIYFTPDGCLTWVEIPFAEAKDLSWPEIYFSSYKIGWIVGYVDDFSLHTHTGRIFRTDDAGITWREQNNITYLPDYFSPKVTRQSIFKIYAQDNGRQYWALGEEIGILHTSDGGEHWSPDTIPTSPGMNFTDLAYNKYTNTLWLTSGFNGIWKYEIPSENAIKNPATVRKAGTSGKILYKNNGILFYPVTFSDAITLNIYTVAGRMVYTKSFSNLKNDNKVFVPLSTLSSGHYLGEAQYLDHSKIINTFYSNINILK